MGEKIHRSQVPCTLWWTIFFCCRSSTYYREFSSHRNVSKSSSQALGSFFGQWLISCLLVSRTSNMGVHLGSWRGATSGPCLESQFETANPLFWYKGNILSYHTILSLALSTLSKTNHHQAHRWWENRFGGSTLRAPHISIVNRWLFCRNHLYIRGRSRPHTLYRLLRRSYKRSIQAFIVFHPFPATFEGLRLLFFLRNSECSCSISTVSLIEKLEYLECSKQGFQKKKIFKR